MQIICRGKTEIDDITQAHTLVERLPALSDVFDGIKDLREAINEAAPGWSHGNRKNLSHLGLEDARHVASVPWFVMTALLAVIPDLMDDDGKKFYQWLEHHPEYKVAG